MQVLGIIQSITSCERQITDDNEQGAYLACKMAAMVPNVLQIF